MYMKFDWYLFDLDGTLTKSDAGIINSAKYALKALGADIPDDAVMRKFIGPPLSWSFMTLTRLSENDAERAIEKYRERYSEIGWKENAVYPGIAPLLRGIKKRGGNIALASAKPEVYCKRIIEHFGLSKYIDIVSAITLDDHSADKEQIIDRALPADAERTRAVMIGDRNYDIEGAIRAGVTPVAAAYGYGAPEEFEGAAHIAQTPNDLWDILIGDERDKGMFITFEGCDGCGKTTQFNMAAEFLRSRGWDIVTSREPGGCVISEKIRDIVLDKGAGEMTYLCESLLYAAARAQHVSQVVRPAVNAGKIMLCDRFLDSSIAYQGYGRELTIDIVRQINAPGTRDAVPDMTILYDLDEKTSRERVARGGNLDRIEIEGEDFTRRVRQGYAHIAAQEPQRVRVVDASRPLEEVFVDTAALLEKLGL